MERCSRQTRIVAYFLLCWRDTSPLDISGNDAPAVREDQISPVCALCSHTCWAFCHISTPSWKSHSECVTIFQVYLLRVSLGVEPGGSHVTGFLILKREYPKKSLCTAELTQVIGNQISLTDAALLCGYLGDFFPSELQENLSAWTGRDNGGKSLENFQHWSESSVQSPWVAGPVNVAPPRYSV